MYFRSRYSFVLSKPFSQLQLRHLCTPVNQKVYLETYGCQMNFSDAEVVAAILQDNGYQRVQTAEEADVALLMTCAIRESAESKVWNRLLELRKLSTKSSPLRVGVLGCMAERVRERLLESPRHGVHLVCGPDAYRDLPRLIQAAQSGQRGMNVALSLEETYADITPVRLCAPNFSTSAFVSVQRGCDNMCAFCIVPWTRGRERSRPLSTIVREVQLLVDQGVREVVLLGQNVNSYCDQSEISREEIRATVTTLPRSSSAFTTVYKPKRAAGHRFVHLLDAVSSVHPELRVRFTSPHPKDFPPEVLSLMAERYNICRQLHLPAQSGSTEVLSRMNRGYSREAYLELVQNVRNLMPDIALSSDFIAGFCGETEVDHEATLSLLAAVRYNFVYCFPYSMREKTKAHRRLVDDVPEDVKKRRHQEIAAEFRKHAQVRNEAQIGDSQLVLVEGVSKRNQEEFYGRNNGHTKVIFPVRPMVNLDDQKASPREPRVGDYLLVKVTGASSQVLRGDALGFQSLNSHHRKTHDVPCNISKSPDRLMVQQ